MHASWKTATVPAALLALVLAGAGCAAGDDAEDPGLASTDGATQKAQDADSRAAIPAVPSGGEVVVNINQNGWNDHDTSTSGGWPGHHHHHGRHGHHGHGMGSEAPAGPNAGPGDQAPAAPMPFAPPPPAP